MLLRVALCLLAALSAAALVCSVAINLWTFSADPLAARFPGFDVLQFGIFPIAGGSAIVAAYFMRKSRSENWRESLFFQIPIVLRVAIFAFGLYAIGLSFEQTMIGDVGVPAIRDGQYVLHSHGKIVRNLTAEEYRIEEAGSARVSSAFQMAFYVAALALAIACLRTPKASAIEEPTSPASARAPVPDVADRSVAKRRAVWRT